MRLVAIRSTLLLLCLGTSSPTTSAFRIYDGIESSLMQAYYGVSDQCLEVLNSTLNCNKGITSKAASGPDNYFWARENVTALCTQECSNSMASWLAAVEEKCDGETVPSSHLTLLAKSIPTLWKEGYDLVCLQDTESNWCLVESQDWQGSDYIRWNPWACDSDDDDDETDIPPECDDPDFSVDQISPGMKDVTKLYDSDLLCSDCFVKLWRQRLMSSLLPNSEHTDYLLEQYEAMQKYCNKKLPVTLYETNLLVPTQTTPRPTATATPLPPTIDTCSGQLIEASDGDIGCVYLADKYNVSTGHLVHITNDMSCEFDSPICVPLPCEIDIVYHTPTCEELAAKYSTDDFNVSRTQLLTWNPYILGSCGYLNDVQRVCKRPPGCHYKASGLISSPTTAGEYFTTATPAEPTRSGTTESCGRYYKIVSGDTCNSVALRFGITFRELKSLNTYLWDNCTNLWSDYDVCVASVSQPPLSKDGTCGPSNDNAICDGTTFGRCCSTSGYCGKGSDYCGSGNCISGACEPAGTATTNGTCGPDWGFKTCTNPSFGPCCSIYGYCGDGNDFCGASHCYSGKCDDDNGGPSINGECGPSFAGNKTCTGTQFGKCCSISGYCGSTDEYCGEGNCYTGACE